MIKGLVILIVALILSFISCSKESDAEKFYAKAQEAMGDNFINELDTEEVIQVEYWLDKSIEAGKSWWRPYWQKNQIYRAMPNSDYNKVKDSFDLWIKNGNTFNNRQKFSYACTVYTVGEKAKGISLFNEIYDDNLNSILDQSISEEDILTSLLSGAFTDSVMLTPSYSLVAKNNDGIFVEIKAPSAILDMVKVFVNEIEIDMDEIIKCEAGSF